MKAKMDKFIRYFDKQMSPKEKKLLENEFSLDPILKEEYKKFKSNFESLKEEVQVDENYFNNIIHRSLKKSSQIGNNYFVKTAVAIPALIIIMFFIFSNESNNNWNVKYDLSELLNEYSETNMVASNLFDEELNYQSYGFDGLLLEDILDEETVLNESMFDYLDNYIWESDINNSFLNQISSAEFEVIYNEMVQKQIIGE